MKNSLLITATFLLIYALQSCSKNDDNNAAYMDQGIITGYDMRYCICCGGLMINFNGDTAASYEDPFFLISNSSLELGITDTTTFPVRMRVDWVKDTAICDGENHIKITRFKRE